MVVVGGRPVCLPSCRGGFQTRPNLGKKLPDFSRIAGQVRIECFWVWRERKALRQKKNKKSKIKDKKVGAGFWLLLFNEYPVSSSQ
jgi:hypothetical protein